MSQKLKIVIVIDSWNDGNGCIVATKRMMKEFEARGHEFTIITTDIKGHEGDLREVPGFYLPGVKESMKNMGFLFGKGKKKVFREAFKDADIVTVQFPFFMARGAVKMANRMGVPIMAGCHIQPQNVVGAMGKENNTAENMMAWLFNFCLFKQVDAIHCPSKFAADLYRGYGVDTHFRVISNGIPREYVPRDVKRPEQFGEKFVIMNVGRHALEKRQELMIDGVLNSKYKDNIQLLLCGKGEDSEKLRERGKELPVEPLVEYISMEDKLTYLNTADLYLQTSVIELESLSCLEALGSGLPCLISDATNSAASQFALDDRFLFPQDDAVSLGRQIDYWYENREELKAKKADALKMADKFRMNRCVDEMEVLYTDVIAHQKQEQGIVLEPGLVIAT
jgi:1,2-diacylglycerol 3-alpha-glucosyltransferase